MPDDTRRKAYPSSNRSFSGIRIKPCFRPHSKAAVFADNGQALEKNGALQCVVSSCQSSRRFIDHYSLRLGRLPAVANTAGACSAVAHCMLTKKGCIFNLSPLKPPQPPEQSAPHQNNKPPLVPSVLLLVDGEMLSMLNMVFTMTSSAQYQLFSTGICELLQSE